MAHVGVVVFIALTGLAGALHRNQAAPEITLQSCKSTCQRFGMPALAAQNAAFSGITDPTKCVQVCNQEYPEASSLLEAESDLAPHKHDKTYKTLKELEMVIEKPKIPRNHNNKEKLEKKEDPDDAPRSPADTGATPVETTTEAPDKANKHVDGDGGSGLDPDSDSPSDSDSASDSDSGSDSKKKGDDSPWGSDSWGWGSDSGTEKPTTTTPATLAGEEWVRPFSLTNGACEHVDNPGDADRYVMEIREVAGGSYYLGDIGFGMPEQTLNMLLDTGSDEIVIKSNDCIGCKGRGFDNTKSTTYINETNGPDQGLTSMSYGSGDVIGQRGFDTVHTGPLSGPNLPIVWVKESNIDMFQDTSKDALEVIVGMAPGLREYVGERLASSMKVRRISQCLPNNNNENGFFVVNDHKPKAHSRGPFNSVGEYYWAAGIQNFRMEWESSQSSYQAPVTLGKPFVGIIDTGTTLLSVPQQTMDELQQELSKLDYDCGRMAELPDLKFDIDGATHFLPPKAYIAEARGSRSFVQRLQKAHKSLPSLKVSEHSHTTEEATFFAMVTEKLYFKKPFLNLKKGVQCMMLFTEPLGMETPEGELAILGMPFFREYAIHFDFCSRQMWTSRSYGDCSSNMGQHPSNVDWCADKDWFSCWFEGVSDFGRALKEGVESIFTNRERPLPQARKIKKRSLKSSQSEGEAEKYTDGLLQLDPKEIRLSEAAKWITSTNTQGGMVSI